MTFAPQEILEHYTRHGLLSNPGPYAHVLETLPSDLDALHQAINRLFIHVWKVRKYDPERLDREPHAVFVRSVRGLLQGLLRLSDALLDQKRLPHKRLIIDCRSFALILCAVLRQRGVPARVRCGFASYLEPTHAQDHWICEFWNGERWVMEDPDVVKHDLSADDFVSGAGAWLLVRKGEVSAERFGYGPDVRARGLWAVRINLLMLRHSAEPSVYRVMAGGLSKGDEASFPKRTSSLWTKPRSTLQLTQLYPSCGTAMSLKRVSPRHPS